MLPTRDLLKTQRHTQTESEGIKKVLHANENQKKARVAILISDKKTLKTVTRDKEGHYIMTKRPIQENITIVPMYVLNIEAPKYIRQILMDIKGEINSNTNSSRGL